MKKYLPLILVESYLILTLFIFYFGPVQFRIHNEELFIFIFTIYHLSFIFGYYLFTKTFKFSGIIYNNKLSNRFFYTIFVLGLFSLLKTYQNLMLTPSIIPFNIVDEVIRGLAEPGLVYSERMVKDVYSLGAESSSRLFNILSIFFSFSKLLFIFLFLYYWFSLSVFKKFLSILYSCLFLSAGIASGTNSVIFIFFIFFSCSIIVIIYKKKPKIIKGMLIVLFFLFLIPLGFFGNIMSERGGGFDYFTSTSPLGDISISVDTPKLDSISSFYLYSLVWLNYYLVQGYYGFSLIIDLDWNWTYGFGNSDFLQRQFLMLTDIDISHKTFQYRVTDIWGKTAQWHSFYGQLANDFGIVGLSILMVALGGLLSRIWLSIIYNNNIYGLALLPIYIIMIIFFPANNQIFGYIDTFSYFFALLIFWYLQGKTVLLSSQKGKY